MYEYLTTHDLLSNLQSGFRPLHSTLTALLDATDQWYTNTDNGLMQGIVFIDLKKAFDTIDHNILLKKLSCYGFSNMQCSWSFP
jgi:retron-type reverse transcriptase